MSMLAPYLAFSVDSLDFITYTNYNAYTFIKMFLLTFNLRFFMNIFKNKGIGRVFFVMFQTKFHESNVFLGKVRKTSLKIQLLFFLSSRNEYTTSKEIAAELEIKNPQQVQQLCREIEEDIQACYKNGEFELVVSQKQGFRLYQNSGDLKLLLNEYNYSELSYNLLTELFYMNPIPVTDFCGKHFVSEATTRRKVLQVNKNLQPFGIRISIGRQLTMIGSEENIRAFYFLSNYLTYQSITNLPIEEDRKKTLVAAVHSFVTDLDQSYTDFQIEMIALLYGTQIYRIKKDWLIEGNPFSAYHFTQKPEQLTDWSEVDWDFFLFMLYLLNLYTPSQQDYQTLLYPQHQNDLATWEQLFFYFFPSDIKQLPQAVEKDLIRLCHFQQVFPKDIYLFHIFPLISVTELQSRYPLHMKRFDHFMEAFITACPHINTYHFMINSLLLTLSLLPLEQRKEQVYLYLECPLSNAYLEHLRSSILERLQVKYQLVFVNDPLSADLVISTAKQFTTPQRDNRLSVHPLLFESDYRLIEEAIMDFLATTEKPKELISLDN